MNLKKIRDFKLELILWTLVVYSVFNLLFLLPMRALGMRDIFMGMNVTLPPLTSFLMNFASFVNAWKVLYLPSIAGGLLFCWSFAIKTLINFASQFTDPDDKQYIKLQLMLALGLLVVYIINAYLTSVMSQALTAPMLRLVNTI